MKPCALLAAPRSALRPLVFTLPPPRRKIAFKRLTHRSPLRLHKRMESTASLAFVRACMPRSPIAATCGMASTSATSASNPTPTVHGAVAVYIDDLERRSSAHSPDDVELTRTRVLGCRHGSVRRSRLAAFDEDEDAAISSACGMSVHRQEILGTRNGTPKRVTTTTTRLNIEENTEFAPLRKTVSL
ncbi:unnamed protein product [Closterium sp. NIES-53]